VCDEFRFIYVRIGKTGSTTMTRSYLAGVSEMVGGPARFEVDCMRIPRYKFLHYFVFTVVRNPWDRALSQFLACFQRNLDVDDHDVRARISVRSRALLAMPPTARFWPLSHVMRRLPSH
jgi:hypothetical protein